MVMVGVVVRVMDRVSGIVCVLYTARDIVIVLVRVRDMHG